ncbi:ABC transporter ATP-binding protein [Granulosicoccus antarcticus]|uniref:Spermidine/putrescine import ATP-binding protein PotA n=1 Tax=Granulosicoccus antarcticus IMCC3135 TaxID=1192854 RepID=A0A2Z2NU61_9GAMM|nr:ABC transporter ATP-binding protein [Granulosicoccus antarcticus]ASJ74035.1 Spermidine/putrescine import ATP-binding protein PotA [Granulosicoccus antarcticus IMCC3135]
MIEISGVSKVFGKTTAVDDVSLSLQRGDFLTIVGPSGCGKTTLLRMIAGFDAPTSGHIMINGQRVEEVPPYQRSIGMVFQKLALFPHMSAHENVAFPLKMRRFDPEQIAELADKYLRLVKLQDLGDRKPHQLSGGQQQRVAIARALSFSPDLLLLDEPLSALDRKLREEMQLEFRRIQQELGVTTINVTHDQREALVMSDRIIVMNEGVVQQADTPLEVYRKPGNQFVANFIGVTSMFKGRVLSVDEGLIKVDVGGTPLLARGNGELIKSGDVIDCAVRAEQVRMCGPDDAAVDNKVTGLVVQRIFEGDRIVYEMLVEELDNSSLYVFDHDPGSHAEYSINERVQLGWSADVFYAFPLTPELIPQTSSEGKNDE